MKLYLFAALHAMLYRLLEIYVEAEGKTQRRTVLLYRGKKGKSLSHNLIMGEKY